MLKSKNKNNQVLTFSDQDRLFFSRLKKRKIKDFFTNASTYLFSACMVAVVIWIVVYIVMGGSQYLSWKFLTSPYSHVTYTFKTDDDFDIGGMTFEDTYKGEDTYFSSKWGISLKTGEDNDKKEIIYVVHIEENSPIYKIKTNDSKSFTSIDDEIYISYINFLVPNENPGGPEYLNLFVQSSEGASAMAEAFDKGAMISDSSFTTVGGGIRGSLITTLVLIGLTLIIALPLGVGAAIYLASYAKDNFITKTIRTLIDVTSGIPSIIFGLAGAVIFIPFTSSLMGSRGGNVLSGALTMAMMLLPIIIKTTEESIKVIPKSMEQASLALGASKTETVFKIIIPNAIPGILSSTLLSIGRIIGESAALVFAMGTNVLDSFTFDQGGATLSVHIWKILGLENPQYGSACAIAIIILVVVMVLSLLVKLISLRLNRFKKAR